MPWGLSWDLWCCPSCCQGLSYQGNQPCDAGVASSICTYQFLKREILDKAFIELSQRGEEKEQAGSSAGAMRCGTQRPLLPMGSEEPLETSKLFTRASPCVGLAHHTGHRLPPGTEH